MLKAAWEFIVAVRTYAARTTRAALRVVVDHAHALAERGLPDDPVALEKGEAMMGALLTLVRTLKPE
jgi:hypothetical protein